MADESDRRGDWFQTYTGKRFWPYDPRASEVDVVDVVRSLSMQCRFNGHCAEFYSVAQHSVLVESIVDYLCGNLRQRYAALLHDAAEAYTGDMIRPLKLGMPEFRAMERGVEAAVEEHFHIELTAADRELIKTADVLALFVERRDLLKLIRWPSLHGWDSKDVHSIAAHFTVLPTLGPQDAMTAMQRRLIYLATEPAIRVAAEAIS